jgi:hypothetical protein
MARRRRRVAKKVYRYSPDDEVGALLELVKDEFVGKGEDVEDVVDMTDRCKREPLSAEIEMMELR